MGYLHIENLYKNQDILLFRECFALEKVHGTSAHLTWMAASGLTFFAGGESHPRFVKLFDADALAAKFAALGHPGITVYGEAYGGSQQGMSKVYGKELRFIVFDLQIGDVWLAVPQMQDCAEALGFEVVPWSKAATDLATLDALRDAPSEVAIRRGCGEQPREGVVLHPPIEVTKNDGSRIIAKHKTERFSERATPQKVLDPAALAVLTGANAIADEWVTEMRLSHVLDKLPKDIDITATKSVIGAMLEDVFREAVGEIVASKEARAAIGKRTAQIFHQRLNRAIETKDERPRRGPEETNHE